MGGTGKKRERIINDDELEMSTERRRSSRIVALEEKRQQEKKKKLALAAAKKHNIDTKNKEKGKAVVMDARDDDLHHLDDLVVGDKLGTTEKGWKDRAFYQLISTFKAIQEGRPINDESTSVTNVSSLNRVPEKRVLESVLDFLQRKDSDELFGEPISFNTIENRHLNVNDPMDFGTIRAKVHDGMYATLEQFKRDVFLICFNAMNAYPATSRYYKVAKGIGCHAIKIFESLSTNPEHFGSEVSFNKRQSKKPSDRQLGTSRLPRASAKPTGRNSTRLKVSKTDKRIMYQPPNNNTLVSEVLNCSKSSNLQMNKYISAYRESLLRFVKDMGPTAQNVAAKKLEPLNSQQLQHGNTSNPNPHEKALAPQITHQLTPQAQTQPITHISSQRPSLPLQYYNKPLTIPGIAPQQNRIANTIPSSVNIRNNTDRGKNLPINDNWQSYAAALMYNSVYNTDEKGKNQIGCESSNARGAMDTTSYAVNGNMASRVENTFNHIRHQNTSGSSSNVHTYVHPTSTIPIMRTQSNPVSSYSISSNRFLRLPQNPPARPVMPSINSSHLSVMSQPMPQNSAPSVFGNNNLINTSVVSPMSYSRPMNSMPGMNFLSSGTLLNAQATNHVPNEPRAYLFCLDTPYHPGDFQAIMGSSEISNSSRPMQVTSQMNPLGRNSSSEFYNSHPMQITGQMNPLGRSSSLEFYNNSHPMQITGQMNPLGQSSSLSEFNNNSHPTQATGHMNSLGRSSLSEFYNNSHPMQFDQMNPLGQSTSTLEFNNNSHPMQMLQVNGQVNRQMNLLGASSSSASQAAFLSGALNYNGGGGALVAQQENANAQVLDDDDPQPSLTLRL